MSERYKAVEGSDAAKLETGGPAFPYPHERSKGQIHGMTLRTYAAIKLGVPQSEHDWINDMIRENQQARAALQSPEIQALRKDAGRYRWLRADNAYFPEENYMRGGQELDAAIDAAMEKRND